MRPEEDRHPIDHFYGTDPSDYYYARDHDYYWPEGQQQRQHYSNEPNVACIDDFQCCATCRCIVDPMRRTSQCVNSHWLARRHLNDYQGDYGQNEQDRNTERGHFELGYWCLKDSDCESKHCAQVGPRKYDKECKDTDFVDFKLPERKKRTHHRREPLEQQQSTPEAEAES